eukprot:13953702-Heterocapsa_arctica.AAC.1
MFCACTLVPRRWPEQPSRAGAPQMRSKLIVCDVRISRPRVEPGKARGAVPKTEEGGGCNRQASPQGPCSGAPRIGAQ